MKAVWNGTVIAESDDIVTVENNAYFPLESLVEAHFEESTHTSRCGWKGTANYFSVVVDGKRNENAAWIYKTAMDGAKQVEGRVAFWKGVTVS